MTLLTFLILNWVLMIRGLHTHKHAHAPKHFHFDAWQTLWKPYPPDLSCTPEVLCIISAQALESSDTIKRSPLDQQRKERKWMAAFGAEGPPSVGT